MIASCFLALLSYWHKNPLQIFAYLSGVALATALWSGVQAINLEAKVSYKAAAETLGEGQYDLIQPKQDRTISKADYVSLRKSGWLVSPVVDGYLNNLRLVGMDPLTLPSSFLFANANITNSIGGSNILETLFANESTAKNLIKNVKVVVDQNVAPGMAVGDISLVQRLLKKDKITYLIVHPEQPLGQKELELVAPHLTIKNIQQMTDISQLTDSFHLNLSAFGLLSFAVGLFIVHSTIGLAFEQRRAMMRSMRSMGVSLRTLIIIVTIEMIILAVIGALIGIVLGYLIAGFLLPDVAATLRGLYGANISGNLQLRPDWWLSGLIIALLGTALAMSSQIWQITKLPILASAKPRAWMLVTTSHFTLQMKGAILLLTLGGICAILFDGLIAGFALLGALLVAAAASLPALLGWSLRKLQKYARTTLWGWFWADTRQQLPGLSLALMALLLAVSANIGVSTMVSSFRLTFISFLDQRLAPELFLQVSNKDQSTDLNTFLSERGIEVLPLMSNETVISKQPVELFGIKVGNTYRDNWRFLDATENPWDTLQDGNATIVNEQFARRTNLWVGDPVNIASNLTLPIAAIVGDYGNPKGQVIINDELFSNLFPKSYPARFGIRTNNPAKLQSEIINQIGIDNDSIIDQKSLKAFSLEIFERTFLVTSALNILTLGVASFAILMSLLTLADRRIPQLSPIWALGLTRSQIGKLELLRAVLLALFVVVFSVPTGLVLAWVLLNVINVKAFGWQLPMFFFPMEYLKLGFYALFASFLAATWPSLKLIRTPPSDLLKVFASER
ncbi:ABC transporter permease [Paracoccaceae bacterium]|nr:ABC transporter permease [Paracoccaceae bacterium]MDC3205308.1 ABC transporter permease [Paracoccaceae bacterium]